MIGISTPPCGNPIEVNKSSWPVASATDPDKVAPLPSDAAGQGAGGRPRSASLIWPK